MKVIDVVPFYNEADILAARVKLLEGHVDRHIVIEANLTHQGDHKPLHLDGVEPPIVDLPIVRYVADLRDQPDDWSRERAQRDLGTALIEHLSTIIGYEDVALDDLVLSCDVDELVNPAALPAIAEATEHAPVRLGMRMLYYGLDWEWPVGWAHPAAFRVRDLAPDGLSWMRTKGSYPVLPGCGWHVSYFGGRERRRTKVEAFAHRENRAPDVWARIQTGDETGTGPNGEKLTRVDPASIPDALREALGERVA